MIEGASSNISEDDMLAPLKLAHVNIKKICRPRRISPQGGSQTPWNILPSVSDETLEKEIRSDTWMTSGISNRSLDKKEREIAFDSIIG
jgi:polyribonucleotide nucleotidyltransferase